MKLEIIQYTLKCKEELDNILEALEEARLSLFNSDMDEVYATTYQAIEELRVRTLHAIDLLQTSFDEFMKDI